MAGSDLTAKQTPVNGAPRGRTPNFRRFIVTGALVGFVLGAWVSASGILEDPGARPAYVYGWSSGVGYLGLMGAFLGAVIAAVVAVLLDRRP